MTENQAQAAIAKLLGRKELPAYDWETLKKAGLVDDLLKEQDKAEIKDILKSMADWVKIFHFHSDRMLNQDAKLAEEKKAQDTLRLTSELRKVSSSNQAKTNLHKISNTLYSWFYDSARGAYFARRANSTPGVKKFVKEILLGNRLTPEQAYEFLSSVFTLGMPYDEFIQLKESETTYPIVNPNTGSGFHFPSSNPQELKLESSFTVDDTDNYSQIKYFHPDFLDSDASKLLVFPDENGNIKRATILPGSVGDELRKLSISLARQYRWKVADAVWFILTGKMPTPESFVIDYETSLHGNHGFLTIVIKAEPWTPVEYVAKQFSMYQKIFLHSNNRPVEEKTLRLFYYVETQIERFRRFPSKKDKSYLRTLMDGWNEDVVDFPDDWQYKYPSYFLRDYLRARKALLFPEYVYGDKDPDSERKISENPSRYKDFPPPGSLRFNSFRNLEEE